MEDVMFTHDLPRAERVALGIPILYQRPGDGQWFQARVINLSESGVLFEPSELQPGTAVEVILSLPIQIGSRLRQTSVRGGSGSDHRDARRRRAIRRMSFPVGELG